MLAYFKPCANYRSISIAASHACTLLGTIGKIHGYDNRIVYDEDDWYWEIGMVVILDTPEKLKKYKDYVLNGRKK